MSKAEDDHQKPAVFRHVPIAAIEVEVANQPRLRTDDELSDSLRAEGLLNPLTVAELTGDGRSAEPIYLLLAGHRRLAGACKLGWTSIDVRLKEVRSPEHARMIAIVENARRKNLRHYETARFFIDLAKKGSSVDEMASAAGYSVAWTTTLVRLHQSLHPELLELWQKNDAVLGDLIEVCRLPQERQIDAFSERTSLMGGPIMRGGRRKKGRRIAKGRGVMVRMLTIDLKKAPLVPVAKDAVDQVLRYLLGLVKENPLRVGKGRRLAVDLPPELLAAGIQPKKMRKRAGLSKEEQVIALRSLYADLNGQAALEMDDDANGG